jgi:transposase InsO family protein
MLTIIEHTRECHVLRADRALRSEDVLEWLNKAIEEHGAPQYLRSDNGSEFIAKVVQRWPAEKQIKTIYIDPGSPWQNGFVERLPAPSGAALRAACGRLLAPLESTGGSAMNA